jgi:hypothetical protein
MPFTESELRAMLEDNSAEIPSVPDLATIAETHGKKIRRRRQIAGATATAAVLAIGALALPGLVTSDQPAKTRHVVAAPKVSPTQSSGPVDVDYSVFTQDSESVSWLAERRQLLLKQLADKATRDKIRFQPMAVAGTVAGFDMLPPARTLDGVVSDATRQVVMKIRVNRVSKIFSSPAGTKIPLPDEGEIISVLVDSRIPIDRYRKAVPEGARLVAFSVPIPMEWTDENGDTLPVYDYAPLIFEKADRSLIGGPYQGGKVPAPWSKIKTMDELIALAPKLPLPCRMSDPQVQTVVVLSKLLQACALDANRIDRALSSPTPTP